MSTRYFYLSLLGSNIHLVYTLMVSLRIYFHDLHDGLECLTIVSKLPSWGNWEKCFEWNHQRCCLKLMGLTIKSIIMDAHTNHRILRSTLLHTRSIEAKKVEEVGRFAILVTKWWQMVRVWEKRWRFLYGYRCYFLLFESQYNIK